MFRGSVKGIGYPLHLPVSPFTSRASPRAITFQLESNTVNFIFEFRHAQDTFCHGFQIGSKAHIAAGQLEDHVHVLWTLLPPLPQYTFVARRLINSLALELDI